MSDKDSNRKKDSSELMIKLVPIAVIALALSVGAYFVFFHDSSPSSSSGPIASNPSGTPSSTNQATTTTSESPPTDQLTVDQLLKEAGTALKEQRLVSPAGNNALEYYLRILEKEPKNQAAVDALRELFPFATGAVEQSISAGQLDDAKRVIDLLAKSDPANYTLTILRSRLDAKRKTVEREQAQTAAAAAAAAAANKPPVTTAPPANSSSATTSVSPPPPHPTTSASEPPAASSTPPRSVSSSNPETGTSSGANTNTQTVPAPSATPVQSNNATSGETREVVVVKTVPPEYPREAVRKRQEGWVEVEFTVTADGEVTDAHVLNSEPGNVFDREAVRAVQRWTFKPKMENGKPEASRLKRRIEFKLNG